MDTYSVVIPAFNAAKYIEETIASALAQTLPPRIIVVVDDGSEDETAALAEVALGASGIVRSVPNGGVSKARNIGYRLTGTESDHVLFLDADDILMPDMADTLVRHLSGHPEVVACFCALKVVGSDGAGCNDTIWSPRVTTRRFRICNIPDDEPSTPFSSIFEHAPMIPSVTLVRRTIFATVSGFDETFGQPYEDMDLFLRLALKGPVHFVPDVLVSYRQHGGQNTSDAQLIASQHRRLMERWRDAEALEPRAAAVVARTLFMHDTVFVAHRGARAGRQALREKQYVAAGRFYLGIGRAWLNVASSMLLRKKNAADLCSLRRTVGVQGVSSR